MLKVRIFDAARRTEGLLDYPINGAHRGNDHRVVLSGPIWNGPGSEDDPWSGKTGRSVYTGEFTWEEQCNEYFCIDVLDRAKVLTVRTYVNDRLHVAADYDSPHRGLLISGRGVEMRFLGNDHDNTRVFAGHLDDQLFGRGGDDELAGNGGDDLIDGGAGYDELVGNGGDDRLSGDHGQDAIFGGAGSDRLSGGEASDRLRGGTGTDLIRGGAGSDLFLFKSLAEAGSGPGRDVIRDFDPTDDRLDLRGIDADAGRGGDQAFVLIGHAAFSGVAAELCQRRGVVSGDVDGDGDADFSIALPGAGPISEASILL